MTDIATPPPIPGSTTSKIKDATLSIIDAVVSFLQWIWSYVPATVKKYLSTIIVILLVSGVTLWTMRSVLEFKIPSWSSGQAEQPKIITKTVTLQPIGPTFSDFDALRARVDKLESSTLVTQQPAPDKPKAKVRAKKAKAADAGIPDPGSLFP